jgi:phenylacetate-coenzyme A ligase PaaK-like adenylate-forming protein
MRQRLPKGYWNPAIETMSRDLLRELQWRKLQVLLRHVYETSPFYRKRMEVACCHPEDVTSLDDYLRRFPLQHREEIAQAEGHPPSYGELAAVDSQHALIYHQTSGTSGNPAFRTFDTIRDWSWIADMWAAGLYAMGVRPRDRAAAAFGYGVFIGFWGAYFGLLRIGSQAFATGGLDSQARIEQMMDQDLSVLVTTPTYALRLASVAEEMGVDLRMETKIKLVVTSGESRPPSTRRRIAQAFDAYVGDVAGMTEGGTVEMFECMEDPGGMHMIESDYIEEVLDPETLKPVGYGQEGVRVMTSLGREGLPMLRYWTNDVVVKSPASDCSCGRSWDLYQGGILGRLDESRKIRGISFAPAMVEDVVRRFDEIVEYQMLLETIGGLDTLVIHIEPREDVPEDRYEELRQRFAVETKRALSIAAKVEIAPPGLLPRYEMRASRFRDVRPSMYGGGP